MRTLSNEPAILRTKLYIPPQNLNCIVRSRLLLNLENGWRLRQKLLLISAPAGFGKTTLLSSWARQHEGQVAWLSLDESDNDPVSFLLHFMAAYQMLDVQLDSEISGDVIEGMVETGRVERFLIQWINQVALTVENRALVLDDYHLICDPWIHRTVGFFLAHIPSQMQLIISTRTMPPLSLAQLRVQGQLLELKALDLRFTADETQSFFSEVMDLALPETLIERLQARTEGWVVGLQLLGHSLHQGSMPAELESFSGDHRDVVDYLTEQVLEKLPMEIRDFLLKTSILKRLNGALCDAVLGYCGTPGGDALLQRLEALNLFIVPLDARRQWYRYHHLFGEAMQRYLAQSAPEEIPTLHRRASEWFAKEGLAVEAIDHAFQCGDLEWAGTLVESNARSWGEQGEVRTVMKWIHMLPRVNLYSRPRLLINYVWGLLLSGQFREFVVLFQEILPQLRMIQQDPGYVDLIGEVSTLEIYFYYFIEDYARGLELFAPTLSGLPEKNVLVRGVAYVVFGELNYVLGRMLEAGNAFEQGVELCRAANQSFVAAIATERLAHSLIAQGQLYRVAELCRDVVDAEEPAQGGYFPALELRVALALVKYEWNCVEEADVYLKRGFQFPGLAPNNFSAVSGYVVQARVLQSRGEPAQAAVVLEKAGTTLHLTRMSQVILDVAWVRYWLAIRDDRRIQQWVERCGVNVESVITGVFVELLLIALVRVLLDQGRRNTDALLLDQALRLSVRLLRFAEDQGQMGTAIEILVLQAQVYQALDDLSTALVTLLRALRRAEPEGFCRTFVDEGEPMAQLLTQLLTLPGRDGEPAAGGRSEYVQRLLAAMSSEALCEGRPEVMPDFSARELEILRLMAQGMTDQEMGIALHISINTVKTHLRRVYGKLDVHSRTQALYQIRRLGLLE